MKREGHEDDDDDGVDDDIGGGGGDGDCHHRVRIHLRWPLESAA